MTTPDPVTVLIADDHQPFRAGARMLLDRQPQLQVVGEATNGLEAVTSVLALQPDVVLMDLKMPGLNGIDATRQITSGAPHTAVLVLSMFDDDDSVFMAMRVGARGYLLKGATRNDLVAAILAVSRGEAIFGPGIAQRVLTYFVGRDSAEGAFPELTDREREVLHLIAAGHTNPTMAHELFLSPKTIRNHVSNIFAKLQVASRAEAIILARNAGLGRAPLGS